MAFQNPNGCRMLITRLHPTLQLEASAQQRILRLRYLRKTSASLRTETAFCRISHELSIGEK